MIKQIKLNEKTFEYEITFKNVRNINLRIKPDGSIHISANKCVPHKMIEDFLISKSDFIIRAIEKLTSRRNSPKTTYFSEDEVKNLIIVLCKKIYPYFEKLSIKYPTIKFRRMVSQWGNCHSRKCVLTFNTNLMYAPPECIEYVVAHEFTHFLQPNHSTKFYDELAKIMPDWKSRRNKLREISVR